MSTLPTDYDERKGLPLWTFLMEYFPLAFLALVRISVAGDKQHLNNSEPGKMRWARGKSTDQLNTAMRHQFDYGTGAKYDIDGHPHLGKAAWRLLAQLQLDEEARLGIAPTQRPARIKCHVTCGALKCERDGCSGENRPLGITVPKCTHTVREGARDLPCGLSDGHPGTCKVMRAPRICTDCGADLDEGFHASGCLRLDAQRFL